MCERRQSRSLLALAIIIIYAAFSLPARAQAPAAPPPDLTAPPARLPGALVKPDQAITITTEIDKVVIRVGDLIHYKMTISAPAGSQIMMPPPGVQLGEFIIRDFNSPALAKDRDLTWREKLDRWVKKIGGPKDDLVRNELLFTITAYDTGDLVVPPLPFGVKDPAGGQHAFYTESARVRVVPFTSPDDLTIKDIKPPAAIPVKWSRLTPYVAIPLAVLAAALVGLVVWLRRRHEAEQLLTPRPAHETALEALAELEASDLLGAGDYELFYTRLSYILRRYLAGRFLFYALEFTTTEVLDVLKYKDLGHGDHERVRRLLGEADLVKFARHQPDPDQRNSALARAREIIANTRPPETDAVLEQAA